MELKVIAKIHTDFPEKFGIPRQSGLVKGLRGKIVFEPAYRTSDAVRGMDGFSHLWLLWGFSKVTRKGWSATVAPPRLGGKKKMGVFATRSPFRPNPIGLSSVKLERVEYDEMLGPVLWVTGIDMLDGTPIYDIKPYLPYADCKPEAVGGFASAPKEADLVVHIPEEFVEKIPEEKRAAVIGVLAQDPRPSYQDDPERVYGMSFGGMEIKFRVDGDTLTVCGVEK